VTNQDNRSLKIKFKYFLFSVSHQEKLLFFTEFISSESLSQTFSTKGRFLAGIVQLLSNPKYFFVTSCIFNQAIHSHHIASSINSSLKVLSLVNSLTFSKYSS